MKKIGIKVVLLLVLLAATWAMSVKADAATLKYDKNGGYTTITPITIPANEFTLTDKVPTYSFTNNKAFLGWSTNKNAIEPEYLRGQKVKFDPAVDVTLYAVWKDFQYSVAYDYNGGECREDVAKLTAETAYKGYFQVTSYYPTKTGYDFLGWSTDPKATEAEYLKGEYYQYNYEDYKVLYAVLKRKTYTVTFYMNGGTGSTQTRIKEYDIDLDISDIRPTRTGYDFIGWHLNASYISAYYTDSYTDNLERTLYAIWKKKEAEKFLVTYDANGGSGAPNAQYKTKGTALTLSKVEPIREGASFVGWAMTKTANSPDIGETYNLDKAITLYAVWQLDQYTITFDDNGGVYGPGSAMKSHGVTLVIPNVKPTREDYTFLGWATTKDAKTPEYKAGASYTLNGDKTLYAVWIEKGAENLKPGEQFIKIKASTKIPYKKNKKVSLKATTNGGGKLSYKSSNKKAATVDKKGKLTIKGYGKTIITITAAAKGEYIKTVKKFTIQVVPAKVTLSKVTAVGGKKVTIKWKKVKDTSGYEMYLSLDKNFNNNTYKRAYKKADTGAKLTGLAKGKTYYFKIRAYKTVKGKKYYGAWSKVKSVKVK